MRLGKFRDAGETDLSFNLIEYARIAKDGKLIARFAPVLNPPAAIDSISYNIDTKKGDSDTFEPFFDTPTKLDPVLGTWDIELPNVLTQANHVVNAVVHLKDGSRLPFTSTTIPPLTQNVTSIQYSWEKKDATYNVSFKIGGMIRNKMIVSALTDDETPQPIASITLDRGVFKESIPIPQSVAEDSKHRGLILRFAEETIPPINYVILLPSAQGELDDIHPSNSYSSRVRKVADTPTFEKELNNYVTIAIFIVLGLIAIVALLFGKRVTPKEAAEVEKSWSQ